MLALDRRVGKYHRPGLIPTTGIDAFHCYLAQGVFDMFAMLLVYNQGT